MFPKQLWTSDVTAQKRAIIAAKTPTPKQYYFAKSNDYRLTVVAGRILCSLPC
jgi:hypothetical protein